MYAGFPFCTLLLEAGNMSMADLPPGAHVTYSQQFRRCNKPDCPACQLGKPGHGPYWFAYWREGSRRRSRYLGKQAPPAATDQLRAPAAATASAPVYPALRVRTLGGFTVWRGTETMPATAWTQRAVARLFKCLVTLPGQRLHREALVELLWPEAEPEKGTQNLRHALHRLRRLLDPERTDAGYVRMEGDTLILLPAPEQQEDWLDADTFALAAAQALAGQDAALCRAALSLYAGEYLPEDRYEQWANRRREELRQQHLAILLHLAGLAEQAGRLSEAARCLRALLAVDACHEPAACALMRVQTLAGRHTEAIRTYQQLATALAQELDLAPACETKAQYQAVLAGRQAGIIARTNLPTPLTSFLGREQEVVTLTRLLTGVAASARPAARKRLSADLPRLVTITGTGGCGKTRLAIELGHELQNRYVEGLWLIELAAFPPSDDADPELIAQQTCSALGLQPVPERPPLAVLCAFLAPRHTLLILDNCEHLMTGCVALVAAVLVACPQVQVLATSRQALGMLGETVWRLPSLAVPPDRAEIALSLPELVGHAAVRLLVERGRAVKPAFALTIDNRRAVVEICRQLDGIPLAIELAAARLAVLSAEELASRLSDRFRLLVAGNGAALPRHQTLRAVMGWSYQLLNPPERALLRALGVFAGGWTLGTAEQICADLDVETSGVLDLLSRLVSKSLAQVDDTAETPEGETRYRLLETVRQYAVERLRSCGEEAAVRERHARWCLELAEQAKPRLQGADQAEWLARLEVEHDNLRVALQWSIREGGGPQLGLRLACNLGPFWEMHGHYREGRLWLEQALAQHPPVDATLRTTALTATGVLAYWLGDLARAQILHEESLALRRTVGDPVSVALGLLNVGGIAFEQGDYARTQDLYEESLDLLENTGETQIRARVLNNVAVLAGVRGDHAREMTMYERSCRMWRELGDTWSVATVLTNLGNAASALGEVERARDCYRESLIMRRDLADRDGVKTTLEGLGYLAHRQGDDECAARVLAAAAALATELGSGLASYEQVVHDQVIKEIRQELGDDAFVALSAEGRAMTHERAIDYALWMVGEGTTDQCAR